MNTSILANNQFTGFLLVVTQVQKMLANLIVMCGAQHNNVVMILIPMHVMTNLLAVNQKLLLLLKNLGSNLVVRKLLMIVVMEDHFVETVNSVVLQMIQ